MRYLKNRSKSRCQTLFFLETDNLFSNKEFGFREGVFIQDALVQLILKIYSGLNENHLFLCVFLDLLKTFDTICHILLLITEMTALGDST